MTLGNKLKKTLDELEVARIKGINAQHDADLEKIRKEREDISQFLNSINENFVQKIESEKVPLKKIDGWDKQKWVDMANKGCAKHQDLWNNFIEFWKVEDLKVKITHAHDGVGVKSWLEMTVVPDVESTFNP